MFGVHVWTPVFSVFIEKFKEKKMFGGRETSCVNAMDPHAKEEGLTKMETERKGKKQCDNVILRK